VKDLAPCVGQHQLFDSTDLRDHLVARAICVACPMLTACAVKLREAQEASAGIRNSGGGPSGTWAGKLMGKRGGRVLKIDCGTDAGYYRHRYLREKACAGCKRAHAAANRQAAS
jgi:hypothetical protein